MDGKEDEDEHWFWCENTHLNLAIYPRKNRAAERREQQGRIDEAWQTLTNEPSISNATVIKEKERLRREQRKKRKAEAAEDEMEKSKKNKTTDEGVTELPLFVTPERGLSPDSQATAVSDTPPSLNGSRSIFSNWTMDRLRTNLEARSLLEQPFLTESPTGAIVNNTLRTDEVSHLTMPDLVQTNAVDIGPLGNHQTKPNSTIKPQRSRREVQNHETHR